MLTRVDDERMLLFSMKKLYKELGGEIKELRQVAGETIAEVGDAVELDEKQLIRFENGDERPDEDILAMILSHFEVNEEGALRMWRLAGYDNDQKQEDEAMSDDKSDNESNQIRINIPGNSPVLYTDMVQVMSNQYGVVLHFLQLSPNQQANVVSRIGMSKEHARSLLELLKNNLEDED